MTCPDCKGKGYIDLFHKRVPCERCAPPAVYTPDRPITNAEIAAIADSMRGGSGCRAGKETPIHPDVMKALRQHPITTVHPSALPAEIRIFFYRHPECKNSDGRQVRLCEGHVLCQRQDQLHDAMKFVTPELPKYFRRIESVFECDMYSPAFDFRVLDVEVSWKLP